MMRVERQVEESQTSFALPMVFWEGGPEGEPGRIFKMLQQCLSPHPLDSPKTVRVLSLRWFCL